MHKEYKVKLSGNPNKNLVNIDKYSSKLSLRNIKLFLNSRINLKLFLVTKKNNNIDVFNGNPVDIASEELMAMMQIIIFDFLLFRFYYHKMTKYNILFIAL